MENRVPRVYPSQIVDLLDQISPDRLLSSELSAVIDLLSELPSELLAISGNDYSKYRISIQEINGLVDAWKNGRGDQHKVHQCANSLEVIRDLLSKCPDESPSPSTAELLFITDTSLRESIRNDISAAGNALHDGLWKAATVLAGAAAEALLRWAITERKSPTEVEAARVAVIPAPRSTDPDQWDLNGYIMVAEKLGLIDGETAKQADLAREFRNLIHPGRSARLAKVCDHGTALSALAAVELIVRDIS